MFIEKVCKHFVHQEDSNGEMAISFCNAMKGPYQNHEGNDRRYPCPLGLDKKRCYKLISMGSDKPQITTNADRIRSVSDEELAKELTRNPPIPCRMCEYYNHKHVNCEAPNGFMCVTEYAEALTLDWLKQPAETEVVE